jgi:hypothetical protein
VNTPSGLPLVLDPGQDLDIIDRLADLVALLSPARPLYVRYSDGPTSDLMAPSVDYESGLTLPGLSVTVLDPPAWWSRPVEDWVARRVCKYAELLHGGGERRPWVLHAEVVGIGPDHEPLVAAAEPIAWIGETALAQSLRRYQQRFQVGRDSSG